MKCHLIRHGVNVKGLTTEELLGCFLMLPEPEVKYDAWNKAFTYEEKTPEQVNTESIQKLEKMING